MAGFLLCIDWDETCTNIHWHNYLIMKNVEKGKGTSLVDELMYNDNAIKNFYKEKDIKFIPSDTLAGLKNQSALIEFIKKQLELGNHIAITSYTGFPEIIKPALSQAGLSEEQLAKIYIRPYFPPEPACEWRNIGKKYHIKDAMKHFSITNATNVILIDDSESNTAAAKLAGHYAISVPRTPNPPCTYLKTAETVINKLTGEMPQVNKLDSITQRIESEANMREKSSSLRSSCFVPLKKAKHTEDSDASTQTISPVKEDKKEESHLSGSSSSSHSSPRQQ